MQYQQLIIWAIFLMVVDYMLLIEFGSSLIAQWDYYQTLTWFPQLRVSIACFALILSVFGVIKINKLFWRLTSLLGILASIVLVLWSLIRIPTYYKAGEYQAPNGSANAIWYWEDPQDSRISIVTLKRSFQPETTVFLYERLTPGHIVWRDQNIFEIHANNGRLVHTVDIRRPAPYVYFNEQEQRSQKNKNDSVEQLQREVDLLKKR